MPQPSLSPRYCWILLVLLLFSSYSSHVSVVVDALTVRCAQMVDCIQRSNLTCTNWINQMEYWKGQCCSFQDDLDTGGCQLTIVGSCEWYNPALAAQYNTPTSTLYPGSLFIVDEKVTKCPESLYNAFATQSVEHNTGGGGGGSGGSTAGGYDQPGGPGGVEVLATSDSSGSNTSSTSGTPTNNTTTSASSVESSGTSPVLFSLMPCIIPSVLEAAAVMIIMACISF